MARNAIISLLVFSMAACAPFPVGRDRSVDDVASGTVERQDRDAGMASGPSAALVQQARSHLAAAEYAEAAVSLERAIRIEPGNAWLWLELARVHFASGNLQQAGTHARKASSLAGSDDVVRNAAQDLLDEIAADQP